MEHARLAIELLQAAHDLCRRSPKPAPRRIHHIGGLIATEHLALGDAATAQRLLQVVVGVPALLLTSFTGGCTLRPIECSRESGINFQICSHISRPTWIWRKSTARSSRRVV